MKKAKIQCKNQKWIRCLRRNDRGIREKGELEDLSIRAVEQ
jgi:hypothetical protein